MDFKSVNKMIDEYNSKNCILSELIHFERGKNITAAEMKNGDIPVVSAGLGYSGFHNKYNVTGPSITISSSGANAGIVLFHNYNFWAADCLYSKKSTNILFANYFLKYLQPVITNLQRGAAQPHVYSKNVNNLKVKLPINDVQKKIASILYKYDQLIENNNKRIKILEQIAENLYKEWFVRFRFPGYENCKFENGIPEGWCYGEFSQLGSFVRGKNITSEQMIEGDFPVISAGIQPSGYHNDFNVIGASITISSSGANAGVIGIHYNNIWAADCNYINAKVNPNIYYLYQLLKNIQPVIFNLQRGAAQPHVYSKDVNRIKMLIPSRQHIEKANLLLQEYHLQIYKLQTINANLTKQRDLLLPRLMSGKLKVS